MNVIIARWDILVSQGLFSNSLFEKKNSYDICQEFQEYYNQYYEL